MMVNFPNLNLHSAGAWSYSRYSAVCNYSHLDAPPWEEFHTHLSPMERTGLISGWSDKAIPAGTEWEPQILDELEQADLVLRMLPPDMKGVTSCRDSRQGWAEFSQKLRGIVIHLRGD